MKPEPNSPDILSSLEQVTQYHHQTKHQFNQYARSLGYLDWANQPNPFRRYEGAPLIKLPLLSPEDQPVSPPYESLFSSETMPPQPLTLFSLSRFFEYALSLTAWKEYGSTRWALRSNPSSGNLHPTEGYLLIGAIPGLKLESGLYHYAPKEHALEHRWSVEPDTASDLFQALPPDAFLVGLSSIHWREAWKYGERAFRYCQHDTGHALGTMRIAAATLGWNLRLLDGLSDDTIGRLLGLSRKQDFDGVEQEYPELLAVVWPLMKPAPAFIEIIHSLSHSDLFGKGAWNGRANRLSKDEPVQWDIIDVVTEATWKHDTTTDESPGNLGSHSRRNKGEESSPTLVSNKTKSGESIALSAGHIIHQRRSAVDFDGQTGMTADRFYLMLDRILPRASRQLPERPMPWDAWPWDPTVHLALFVHRIDGLEPGLYWFNRFPEHRRLPIFQAEMHSHFLWTKPDGCPDHLPLYLLEEGNGQKLAKQLSCGQDIAGDSAFSLGMLAEFDDPLQTFGPWFYKRLFWETGLVGQVLYLEAEAAGIRATGIGCFFDNPVHEVLGFHPKTTWQSLYHFTMGGPVDDGRLTTLPPYGNHLS
ncbi:MAG: SagB/ThcOx family dehydrogenase [Nitrospirales bacterium]|nr:SagB/ThcOx family dehydrogenase [Nitrospirales bacterium]